MCIAFKTRDKKIKQQPRRTRTHRIEKTEIFERQNRPNERKQQRKKREQMIPVQMWCVSNKFYFNENINFIGKNINKRRTTAKTTVWTK